MWQGVWWRAEGKQRRLRRLRGGQRPGHADRGERAPLAAPAQPWPSPGRRLRLARTALATPQQQDAHGAAHGGGAARRRLRPRGGGGGVVLAACGCGGLPLLRSADPASCRDGTALLPLRSRPCSSRTSRKSRRSPTLSRRSRTRNAPERRALRAPTRPPPRDCGCPVYADQRVRPRFDSTVSTSRLLYRRSTALSSSSASTSTPRGIPSSASISCCRAQRPR